MNTKKLDPPQIGIIVLAAATAIIHILLSIVAYTRFNDSTTFIMFLLNGLGYLTLLAATFLPVPIAKDYPKLVRWVFIGFTAITVLGWVAIGNRSALAYADKVIEVVLIALLWLEARKA
ncbi:MAG: hypothetical protein JSV61_11480 [Anaerolineales bacterium]|nr:MAG: hypothetical protein JSV61_11480 [Anaerolineales bacterium]